MQLVPFRAPRPVLPVQDGPRGAFYSPVVGPYGIAVADPFDRLMVRDCFKAVPARLLSFVKRRYESLWQNDGRRPANLWAQEMRDLVESGHLHAVSSEENLVAAAKARVLEVQRTLSRIALVESVATVRNALHAILDRWQIPKPRAGLLQGLIARLSDEKWWRRQIRTHIGRRVEQWARSIGAVNKRAGVYCSDEAATRHKQRQRRAKQFFKGTDCVNVDTGETIPLDLAVAGSLSDPAIRRAELMTRVAGFEDIAEAMGHVGLFVTLTCPSRMHSHGHDGSENPKYDGTSPREGQWHLRKQWERFRAWANRQALGVYGLRVCEPHHDGAPHWHLLLWCAPQSADRLLDRMRALALEVDGNEPGAARHRFTVKRIDPAKGTAAGYVAKYVAKNLDGHSVGDDDEAGAPADSTADRVRAWASTWGLRQFQQIGGPAVTVWRELRRLATSCSDSVLESLRAAADAGEWAKFVMLMGGPICPRRRRPASVWSVTVTERRNAYGEPAGPRIKGVAVLGAVAITRVHEWVLRPRSGPWTRGNNCTGPGDGVEGQGRGQAPPFPVPGIVPAPHWSP